MRRVNVEDRAPSPRGESDRDVLERAGYLEVNGIHIYSFIHGVSNPVARVLLAGPFASERFSSYIPWVRWARYLASRGIEALRFDYGGVGESTGNFEAMGFSQWSEQVEGVGRWFQAQQPEVPLILHGLELGALLTNKAFRSGIGDSLLMWSVPRNASEVLRRALWRQVFMRFSERKSLSDYIRVLEANQPLEVDGYVWSGRLWREALEFGTAGEADGAGSGARGDYRVRAVKLEGPGASVFTKPSMGRYVALNPDLTPLFAQNAEWILQTVAEINQIREMKHGVSA